MKVFLFITIIASGNPQTQLIPMDTWELCEAAGKAIVAKNNATLPGTTTTFSCIKQGN